jgi:hypothetical protein
VRRLLPLLALVVLAGCGDSGGSHSPTGSSEPIVIDSPAPNAAVQSPFHVSGTANTFEATFTLELRTGGRRLVRKRVTATSGSGTRGSFAVELRYSVPEETRGELRAYEISAANGQPINTVIVPISLLP